MSSNPPDPETFQTDASHPLQGTSLIGIDRFIKSMDLPNGQKLEQDEGGNKLRHAAGGNDPTSFPKNHGVNNQQVYSPRTTILANNQDNFDQSKVYVNAVTIVLHLNFLSFSISFSVIMSYVTMDLSYFRVNRPIFTNIFWRGKIKFLEEQT
jgi:hypothetical protein